MMHDFALTENYVILLDLPVTFSLDLLSGGREMPYTWNPAHQARVGLMRREPRADASTVRWIDVDPCWVFHTLNAYDDGDRVVVDLVRYEGSYDVSHLRRARAGHPRAVGHRPSGRRWCRADWTIDTRNTPVWTTGRSAGHAVTATPRRSRNNAEPPSSRAADASPTRRSLTPSIKHDFATGTAQAHEFGPGATAGEAVSPRLDRKPPKTTAMSWPSCTIPTVARVTW